MSLSLSIGLQLPITGRCEPSLGLRTNLTPSTGKEDNRTQSVCSTLGGSMILTCMECERGLKEPMRNSGKTTGQKSFRQLQAVNRGFNFLQITSFLGQVC